VKALALENREDLFVYNSSVFFMSKFLNTIKTSFLLCNVTFSLFFAIFYFYYRQKLLSLRLLDFDELNQKQY